MAPIGAIIVHKLPRCKKVKLMQVNRERIYASCLQDLFAAGIAAELLPGLRALRACPITDDIDALGCICKGDSWIPFFYLLR
ncbi:MAG: hypothetical protein AB1461_00435 [Thermodesulfobacteriota bacterium]